jgi:hypothetical protein
MKECDKRKNHINNKLHIIYISYNKLDTVLVRPSLHFTQLHFTTLHSTTLHYPLICLDFQEERVFLTNKVFWDLKPRLLVKYVPKF